VSAPLPGAYHPRGTGPGRPAPWVPAANLALFALAVAGGLAGIGVLWIHLTSDPLADVRAYYDAAARLNAGRPLYPPNADPNLADFYRYPPLLAIVLRPAVAVLPFHVFALLWEAVIVAAFVGTIRRIGTGRRTWYAVGLLGVAIGWALAIGQAQVITTFLLAFGTPFSVALAGQLKVFPILASLWWLGRREWGAVVSVVMWSAILVAAQWLLAPTATTDFLGTLTLDQVGQVRNISPYVISPALWVVLAGAATIGVVVAAPTRWGWPAAVALAALVPPRLLLYMPVMLLAALREPDEPDPDGLRGGSAGPPDAAEAYVAASR
jgi:hypothetical protein